MPRFRLPIIKMTIGKTEYPALVDSGSQICCISQETMEQLRFLIPEAPTFPVQGVRISGAFQTKQQRVTEQVLLPFQLENEYFDFEFLVVPKLTYPLILGVDFLRFYNANIDLANKQIVLGLKNKNLIVPELHLQHDFATLPESTSIRLCSTNHSLPSNPAELSNEEELDDVFNDCVNSANVSEIEKQVFKDLLNKNKIVFNNQPGVTPEYLHSIRLKDYTPFSIHPYAIPIAHRDAVDKEINRMLEWGIIKRTNSPYCSPLMTTVKRDGSVRLCLDARHLNQRMLPDNETPRSIDDILRNLGPIQYMSSLDLSCGYWQIPINEDHQQYTAFRHDNKVYCFRRLPFGLKTAVASFSRAINLILQPHSFPFVHVYLDDILIVSSSFDEHMKHLQMVLSRLNEAGLTVKLGKCKFLQKELSFLGYILDANGLRTNPERTQAIQQFPTPTNVKKLQSFLGLCNFDRHFSENFASLSAPLTSLLRKKAKWEWNACHQEAFEKIKDLLSKEVTLYHPNFQKPFFVMADASDVALGAMLFQKDGDEKRVVAYASRLLMDRERRYSVSEREALGIVFALKKWRVYLLHRSFTIYTDHRSLSYLNTCRLLSSRIGRWALALQEYDFQVIHVPGKHNIVADILSRNPPVRQYVPEDKTFEVLALRKKDPRWNQLLKDLPAQQAADSFLGPEIEKIHENKTDTNRFVIFNNLLFVQNSPEQAPLLCIPNKMAESVIRLYHESAGHFGIYKVWCALRADIWMRHLHRETKKVLKTCDICQRAKTVSLPSPGFEAIIPTDVDDLISVDLYGTLPRSRGGVTCLLVILNVFTKYVTLYPLKRATAQVIVKRLREDYFVNVLKPKRILSDQGTQFSSTHWKNALKEEGIQAVYSSVRHPQGNPVERVMRELGRLFRTYCHENHKRWAYEVENISEFLNNTIHESIGCAPVELQFRQPRKNTFRQHLQYPQDRQQDDHVQLFLARETFLSKAQRREAANPGKPYKPFEVGQLVLLKANNISSATDDVTKKFCLLFEGPYRVKKAIHHKTYVLEWPESGKERGVFHACHLKIYNT